ncbi:MAG: hypothetical protein L0323_07065 [Planctomycetes bacterium]|nr:hypothetical protein [Planctomycetota bacterium]
MTDAEALATLPESEVAGLPLRPAGAVNLRRDLHLFVEFVRRNGLRRGFRDNSIPKGAAAKLAKILSWREEAERVEREGRGVWSDKVSWLARALGLVRFDEEGEYRGYSSQEPSFPENDVEVEEKGFAAWLARDPLEKERAILSALVETTESEFFHPATLLPGGRFDTFGCATGPASRMKLPSIRRALLHLLADLPAGAWIPTRGLVELVRSKVPALVLDPALREPLRSREEKGRLEDLYVNFREGTVRDPWRERTQLSERTPDVFLRVEGRFLEYFLQEIPYLAGFVDLALAPQRRAKGDDPVPPLESVRAFRLAPRLRQIVRGEKEISRVSVTVLPNFEVLVEAPSYPERELEALAPLCERIREDGPVHILRLDREAVLVLAAAAPSAPPVEALLERLSGRALPPNVAAEVRSWCGRAEKLALYEEVALVEVRGPAGLTETVRGELGRLVVDDRPAGFLLARDPESTVGVLERRLRFPIVVTHGESRFAATDGPFGAPPEAEPERPSPAPRKRARLSAEDLVGYRSEDRALLEALHGLLAGAGVACSLLEGGSLLLMPASGLPRLRSSLRRLADRFDVDLAR